MTVSLKHKFTSAVADGGDTNLVQPSNWNDEHDLVMATGKLLGCTTAGTGAAEEISVGTGLSLSSGTLATGATTPQTNTSNTFTSNQSVSDGTSGVVLSASGSVEIIRTDGGPFIDFKSSTAEDFDVRIQQVSDGLRFLTGGDGSSSERVRIGSSGQIGLSGANYGTSGQVLTSTGSSTAPSWQNVSASATNNIFWENGTTVSADYTITADSNAGTFGPVTVDSGVTVTIPSGSTWTIV